VYTVFFFISTQLAFLPFCMSKFVQMCCGLYVMSRTTGKPLLQVKWGPEKGRLDMEGGVGFGVDGPHSGALIVRRGRRGAVW
jgi:hypothetical protein